MPTRNKNRGTAAPDALLVKGVLCELELAALLQLPLWTLEETD